MHDRATLVPIPMAISHDYSHVAQVVKLLSDNLYSKFVSLYLGDSNAPAAADKGANKPAAPAAGGGGCCVIL